MPTPKQGEEEQRHKTASPELLCNPSYAEAGVDLAKADRLIHWLQSSPARKPAWGEKIAGIGGFAGLFRPHFQGMQDPLLVACTDGVGTKVLLALEQQELSGLGQDLVAMCVNDLYTVGGVPLFFLDYYATGSLDGSQFRRILQGIQEALDLCEACLLGGETAEMPGLYRPGHCDLAGFMVGLVDRAQVLGPDKVAAGDRVFGFPSSGFHSNGYSLIRHWLARKPVTPALIRKLLQPTTIYKELARLFHSLSPGTLKALAHITGGGLVGNLSRCLPDGLVACIEKRSYPTPLWMQDFILEHTASIWDVAAVFNLGVGMAACVKASAEAEFLSQCATLGLNALPLGGVRQAQAGEKEKVLLL